MFPASLPPCQWPGCPKTLTELCCLDQGFYTVEGSSVSAPTNTLTVPRWEQASVPQHRTPLGCEDCPVYKGCLAAHLPGPAQWQQFSLQYTVMLSGDSLKDQTLISPFGLGRGTVTLVWSYC